MSYGISSILLEHTWLHRVPEVDTLTLFQSQYQSTEAVYE